MKTLYLSAEVLDGLAGMGVSISSSVLFPALERIGAFDTWENNTCYVTSKILTAHNWPFYNDPSFTIAHMTYHAEEVTSLGHRALFVDRNEYYETHGVNDADVPQFYELDAQVNAGVLLLTDAGEKLNYVESVTKYFTAMSQYASASDVVESDTFALWARKNLKEV